MPDDTNVELEVVDPGTLIEEAAENTEETPEVNEAEQAVEEAETPEDKVEAVKTLRKLKLKYNQEEYEEELPFEIPDTPEAKKYMEERLQLARMSRDKAAEKSALEKEIRSFVKELKENPEKILSDPDLGIDLKKFAAQIIEKEIENSKKSPEQLRSEKLEKELKDIKDEREKEKTEAQEREMERLQETAYAKYDSEVEQAIQSSGLPKTPYVVKKMAEYMLLGVQNGIDVSAADVLPLVQDEIQNDIKQLFEVAPDELVRQLVGKDKLNQIRKQNLKKAPPVPLKKSVEDTGNTKEKLKPGEKPKTYRDFFGV